MDEVTAALHDHYFQAFQVHGATARGVDWGAEDDAALRYDKMLGVLDPTRAAEMSVSLLDAGCGYGGLWEVVRRRNLNIRYTGIDVCENMIAWARRHESGAEFIQGDIFAYGAEQGFDYVVANGILTQKLTTTIAAMDAFAQQLIRRMYALARIGIAFNVMTTKVNFTAANLYYRNPAELMAWCQAEISPRIRIDHAYRLYEYTVYLYRP